MITGGAGFIGSHLAETLAKDNEVTIIDDLSTGKLENLGGILKKGHVNFTRGSILDRDLLEKAFVGKDIVFHQAALPGIKRSIDDPISTNDVNITGTLYTLIAARNNKIKRVVFASSSAVYGNVPLLPKKENMLPDLESPYALTKLAGEYYCRIFTQLYGMSTVCLRYFNVFGPRQNTSSEYAAVIPRFINSILNNQPPIIYGDGNQTRDFVYVEDIVQANIAAAESESSGVFNIGSGCNITINELAKAIARVLDRDLKPIHKRPRAGDVRDSLADITLAKSIGYKPRYTLDDALRKTINNFRDINSNERRCPPFTDSHQCGKAVE